MGIPLEGLPLVEALSDPRRVAVVGASYDPRKTSGRPIRYLADYGFSGDVIPVTKRAGEISGHTSVSSLREIAPATVDVALVLLPRDHVLPALRDAEAIGVRVAVVIASGFEDRDSAVRRDLEEFAKTSTLRILGPNCVGSMAVAASSYLTFSSVLEHDRPQLGRIGMVTQSGALGNSMLQTLMRRSVGLAHWVSTGDEIDVGAMEVVAGMLASPSIDSVGLFLEGLTDLAWVPVVEDLLKTSGKSLFVLKAARSADGNAAAAGHTGRVVGSSDASRAILADIGATEVTSVGGLADVLAIASIAPGLLTLDSPRVGVVSVSGAAGVIAADWIGRSSQLSLAPLTDVSKRHLVDLVDSRVPIANPLDVSVLDDTTIFTSAVRAMGSGDVCDVVVAVESGLAHDRSVLEKELAHSGPVPLLLTSLSEDDPVPHGAVTTFAEAGVPYLPTIERTIAALAGIVPKAVAVRAQAHDETVQGTHLGLEEIASLLPEAFPWATWRVVDGSSVTGVAAEFGYPVVLKAAGRTVEHRSELGAVAVVRHEAQLARSFARVEAASVPAGDVVLAQQFTTGFELMLSGIDDVELGPVVFVRLGGVMAEKMTLQCVLWGGWSSDRRRELLRESVIGEVLDGYRNGPRYDLSAVNDVVTQVLDAMAGGLSLLELNPVIVRESGVGVVDAIARR